MPPNRQHLPENIILVDKPSGITSFDVIRRLRQKLGIRKMGHAGTLDPLASGLMIIGINDGTKLLTQFLKLPKVYEVEITFGFATDTGDSQGQVLETKPVPEGLSRADIEKVLHTMVGKLDLPVPIYSAIKRKGKKLYELARAGGTEASIQPPVKPMEVKTLSNISDFKNGKISFQIGVSSGTYVRSLVTEIGQRLHLPATVSALRRLSIGEYKVTESTY